MAELPDDQRWRRFLEPANWHPAANLFPLASDHELAGLTEDIRRKGLLNPVVILNTSPGEAHATPLVLDGRNRLIACERAGIRPNFAPWIPNGLGPTEWVISQNLQRRHLDPSQRAAVSVDAEPLLAKDARVRLREGGRKGGLTAGRGRPKAQGKSALPLSKEVRARDRAATLTGASPRLVQEAKFVRSRDPEAFERIKAGELKVSRAAGRIRLSDRHKRFAKRDLPPGKFQVIYADPPWKYDFATSESRSIEAHYPSMDLDEIKALDIRTRCNDDAVLFLWATPPKLREALAVMHAWGFEYLTNWVWVKDSIGMGYWARQRHELVLIGKRGSPPVPEPATRPDSVFAGSSSAHSAKPESVAIAIDRIYPDARKVELFGVGRARPGWSSWGNEAAGP